MNVFNILKFQIKNIHIIFIVYITSLIFTGVIRMIVGPDFRDDAHLFPIAFIVGFSWILWDKYKRSIGDTESEIYSFLLSYVIFGALYGITVQTIGSQYFL